MRVALRGMECSTAVGGLVRMPLSLTCLLFHPPDPAGLGGLLGLVGGVVDHSSKVAKGSVLLVGVGGGGGGGGPYWGGGGGGDRGGGVCACADRLAVGLTLILKGIIVMKVECVRCVCAVTAWVRELWDR